MTLEVNTATLLNSLRAYIQEEERVCPNPQAWQKLWEILPDRHCVGGGWMPHAPLILAAWDATSVEEKRDRLLHHIEYAGDHGVLGNADQYLRSLKHDGWSYEGDFPY